MTNYNFIIVDDPRPMVRRITLNRPEKRNALSNELRGEIISALEAADVDHSVRVMVVRGSGKAFSAGYDLGSNRQAGQPYHTSKGIGNWPRHVLEGSFKIMDLAKPVIAQVHGYCLAGGSELATACDLVYVADTAKIGYPAVRSISPPDMQYYPWMLGMRAAMELMLTGDSMSGEEAAELGFANKCFPEQDLEKRVLEIAERVAQIPTDLQQINKRSVHRAMEAMGMRQALRAGTEMQALALFTRTSQEFKTAMEEKGLKQAFSDRDGKYHDGRTALKDT